ncbi:MAG: hypothetical protein HQ555_08980 [Candidatus Aminicenantes bacterium]|nr:hypothetical protein [Candidatus Aminicenantes bacterium]
MRKYFLILSIVFCFMLTCCGGGEDADPSLLPVIDSFTATPNITYLGKSVTLSWSVTNADSVAIDHNVGSVSVSGSTSVTMNTRGVNIFILTATNSEGTQMDVLDVTVLGVVWSIEFGGDDEDEGNSVQQTSDGGYIIAGLTNSFGNGLSDVYLIKLDYTGATEWIKTFGGDDEDEGNSVQQTSDGGYIIAGFTNSFGNGLSDVYLIKLDYTGATEWTKTFGGAGDDIGMSVQQTSDEGYIVVGSSDSFGNGTKDAYLIKTDSSGNEEWSGIIGGTDNDIGLSVQVTSDEGYIITGVTGSYGLGSGDVFLIKLDSLGDEEWFETFGGTSEDMGFSVQQTSDGGFIVTGYTASSGNGASDVYVIKTDSTGSEEWTNTYGGSDEDEGHSIQQTSDGGYIIVGTTDSFGAGSGDIYLIKIDSSGNQLWATTFGQSDEDEGNFVKETGNHEFIIIGSITLVNQGYTDWNIVLIKIS